MEKITFFVDGEAETVEVHKSVGDYIRRLRAERNDAQQRAPITVAGLIAALDERLRHMQSLRDNVQALAAAQATACRRVADDIATVIDVAQRRSDPDADHRQMLARLADWRKQLLVVPPPDVRATHNYTKTLEHCLRDILYASDGCVGHEHCNHSMTPWRNARLTLSQAGVL